MKPATSIPALLFCAVFLLSGCGGENTTTGWYLWAENGSHLIITEEGEPLSLSDQSRAGALFEGLDSGDRIEITHGAIAESYPGQAGVYTCKKLSDGHFEEIPQNPVADLESMGYTFDSHTHIPAEAPLTAADPVSGCCGNTVTEVIWNGESVSFWGSDSITLTDILIHLDYAPDQICRCPIEFTVNTEFGAGYGVNLSQAFARCETGQAALTAEQTASIQKILAENCT